MIYLRKENLMYNHQLDTFIVVADNGSFNKAAEALFISPPAVIKPYLLIGSNDLGGLHRTDHRT